MRPASGSVSKDHAAVVADTGRYCGAQCVSMSPDPYGLDEEVNVVGHHLHRVDGESVLSSHGSADLLEAGINRRYEYLPAILWAPNDVILEAEDSPGISRVSRSRSTPAPLYMRRIYKRQQHRQPARSASVIATGLAPSDVSACPGHGGMIERVEIKTGEV